MLLEKEGSLADYSLQEKALLQWLSQVFLDENIALVPMSGDAGFRCYYRINIKNQSFIVVDAPVELSNNQGFIALQKAFNDQGITVPEIIACDPQQGFFCLSDFGDHLLADVLTLENMSHYYRQAIDILESVAHATVDEHYQIPVYDEAFVLTELTIFKDWLLKQHLQLTLSAPEQQKLDACFEVLVDNVMAQPRVVMHRDFHSRNIMILKDDQLGIIDFQDAVMGPITYDVVSLLRDCYRRWPEQNIAPLFHYFVETIAPKLCQQKFNETQWQRWFDLTGIQRHVKASGIFARLYHRDQKCGYLQDIPLTLSYIVDICAKYPELEFLHTLVKHRVLPALLQMNTSTNRE